MRTKGSADADPMNDHRRAAITIYSVSEAKTTDLRPYLLSHSLTHKNFPRAAEIREPRHLIGHVLLVSRRKFVVRISMRARVH